MKSEYIQLISVALGLLGSGGFLAGIYALLKLRPEAGQITVTAAQGALIVQTGVLESLREEIDRLREDIQELRTSLEREQDINRKLRDRIKKFEAGLDNLTNKVDIKE